MNGKRAIKKLMGCGFSRNKAASMQKDGLKSSKSNMLVLEELADVTIILSYVRQDCGFNLEDLVKAMNIKLEREKKRLDKIEKMDELYGVGY